MESRFLRAVKGLFQDNCRVSVLRGFVLSSFAAPAPVHTTPLPLLRTKFSQDTCARLWSWEGTPCWRTMSGVPFLVACRVCLAHCPFFPCFCPSPPTFFLGGWRGRGRWPSCPSKSIMPKVYVCVFSKARVCLYLSCSISSVYTVLLSASMHCAVAHTPSKPP